MYYKTCETHFGLQLCELKLIVKNVATHHAQACSRRFAHVQTASYKNEPNYQ